MPNSVAFIVVARAKYGEDKMGRYLLARYYRLYHKGHIVGFKRILLSRKEEGLVEYLSLAGTNWTPESFDSDGEILLSTPPMGISAIRRVRKKRTDEVPQT